MFVLFHSISLLVFFVWDSGLMVCVCVDAGGCDGKSL